MKKLLSKLTVLFLSLILLIASAGCDACAEKTGGVTPVLPDDNQALTTEGFSNIELNVVDGDKHKKITKTSSSFMTGGSCAYSLVIPSDATEFERLATEEYNLFFKEATGFALPVLTDAQVTSDAKFISIGDTTFLTSAGVTYNAEIIGEAGYVIKTVGSNIYLAAAEDYGILYATYELLHQMLGYEPYYKDFYSLDKGVKDLPLMNYDVVDFPDLDYRCSLHAGINGSADERRMRMRMKDEMFVPQFGSGVSNHNAFKYIPKDKYLDDPSSPDYHPEWYAEDKEQLCYRAHGDEESFNLLVKTFGDQIIQQLDGSDKNIILLGHSDGVTWCTCKHCSEWLAKYKANSSTILHFCNKTYDYVEAHYESLGVDKEFAIMFLAYYGTNPAPAQYNESTGKYEPIDGLKCREGVYVQWGDTNVNYQQSIYGPDNTSYYQSLLAWSVLADKLFIWSYNTNFNNFLVPFDSFNTMRDFYGLMKDLDVYYMYDQGQVQFGGATGWASLKYYLITKYGWDVDCNQEVLTKNFFANVYGPASGIMLNTFNQLRAHFAVIENENTFGGNNAVFENSVRKEYWPERALRQWADAIDSALVEIEIFKNDPVTYEKLYKQIILERITYNYLLISLYDSNNTELKMKTKADIELIGMSRFSEGKNIDTVFDSWGI